jgi:hypothetical protein
MTFFLSVASVNSLVWKSLVAEKTGGRDTYLAILTFDGKQDCSQSSWRTWKSTQTVQFQPRLLDRDEFFYNVSINI